MTTPTEGKGVTMTIRLVCSDFSPYFFLLASPPLFSFGLEFIPVFTWTYFSQFAFSHLLFFVSFLAYLRRVTNEASLPLRRPDKWRNCGGEKAGGESVKKALEGIYSLTFAKSDQIFPYFGCW